MISEIAIVLGILLAAIILFVTELVRVDIVALMVPQVRVENAVLVVIVVHVVRMENKGIVEILDPEVHAVLLEKLDQRDVLEKWALEVPGV